MSRGFRTTDLPLSFRAPETQGGDTRPEEPVEKRLERLTMTIDRCNVRIWTRDLADLIQAWSQTA